MGIFNKILIVSGLTVTSPIWGSIYISLLGRTVNRYIKDESGTVYKKSELGKLIPIKCETTFEKNLSGLGSAPWLLLVGGVPMIPYIFITTFSYIKFLKSRFH
jgi:hypothetical protein